MGRILGLDYGSKRIGVALSDPLNEIALPRPPLAAADKAALHQALGEICEENQITTIVVGLPINMNGSEGDSAARARAFGERVSTALERPVSFLDERLTSAAAERILIEADLSRKKRKGKLDSMAATIILQNYLDAANLTLDD